MWHPATAPVSAGEVYRWITGTDFVNELNSMPAFYDYKTVHAELFGGENGYICDRAQVLDEIKEFVLKCQAN